MDNNAFVATLGVKSIDMNISQSIVNFMPQGGKRMPFFFGLVFGNLGELTSNSISPYDNLLLCGCIRENPDTFLSGGVFVLKGDLT